MADNLLDAVRREGNRRWVRTSGAVIGIFMIADMAVAEIAHRDPVNTDLAVAAWHFVNSSYY